jgi:hypothetical protein
MMYGTHILFMRHVSVWEKKKETKFFLDADVVKIEFTIRWEQENNGFIIHINMIEFKGHEKWNR